MADDRREQPRRGWRRAVVIASFGGAWLGVVIAVFVPPRPRR